MQGYDFDRIHRKGKYHEVPDALSRAVSYIEVTSDHHGPWYENLLSKITSDPHKYPKWRIHEGQLYKLVNSGPHFADDHEWKLVVPKSLRTAVFLENHDAPESGHLGYFKTKKRISSLYYWPKMSSDIARYVRNCEVCKAQKPEQKAPVGEMHARKINRP